MAENFKSGFIAIIGRPNAGKSTFMNKTVGQKIAIMSDKTQTTRNRVQGVLTTEDAQLVFIDTPGIHKPKHRLGDFMVKVAEDTLNEVDAVLFMVNATEGYGKGDQYIMDRLQQVNRPVFLVINKIDLVNRDALLPLIDHYRDKCAFEAIIPISARNGDNLPHLLDELKKQIPDGPQYYPEDYVTDHPEQFIVSELIREKVLAFTQEEIPHSIAVVLDNMEEKSSRAIVIQATIVTERASQKGIVIGKEGAMLKSIGKNARQDIEALLGSKIHLELWVKVQKDWRNRQSQLHEFGFRHDDY